MACEREGQKFISSLRNFVFIENRRAAQLRIEEGEEQEQNFEQSTVRRK